MWAPARRRLTTALVLAITLVAFESLAIATVMPVVADDLGGLGLYGWVFSGFFLGSLLGIVAAGSAADARGTRAPFAVGLALFSLGLAIGGLAISMPMLIAGRVLQGIGAGVVPAVAYTTVGRRYPAELQPRVFAVFSSAWVIPGLVGPVAASAIERLTSWHLVFLALLPIAGVAAAMALPVLSSGPAPERVVDAAARAEVRRRTRNAVVLVAGVALLLAGLSAEDVVVTVPLVGVGIVPAVWAFLHLVPPGTVRLVSGLPAAVALRGFLTFSFFGTDAYISLAMTDARGQETWMAGVALTGATLAWTAGAWIQQRVVIVRGPRWLVRTGLTVIALGIAGTLVGLGSVPVALLIASWTIAGLGMGMAYASVTVTVLGSAAPGEEGKASASLQLTDVLGVSLGTGLVGAFVALGDARAWATGSSLTFAFVVTLAVAISGALAARRLPPRLPGLERGAEPPGADGSDGGGQVPGVSRKPSLTAR